MPPSRYRSDREFEADVRRIFEDVYDLPRGTCQPTVYDSPRGEVDGRAETNDDVVHLIMATRSTSLQKVQDDIGKLHRARNQEQQNGADLIRMWMVVEHQPEGEHVKHAKERRVHLLSLEQLRHRFFNGLEYVEARLAKPFGSARNPENGAASLPLDVYVPLPMGITEGVQHSSWGQPVADITTGEMASRLADGEVIVMLAPFGAGKSVTTREVFLSLKNDLRAGRKTITPIVLNLREHWGERYASNILLSHARDISLTTPDSLTKAWRAGITVLLLDGFDEVASNYVATEGADFMKEARYRALEGVRDLIRDTPAGTGVLIVGRDHYFNDLTELRNALGLGTRRASLVRLSEFTDKGVERFLARNGITTTLPDWLPRKPLLLGYLAHEHLLEETLAIDGEEGFGYVWNRFLDLICVRESERGGMRPDLVRRVLERLSCLVRSTSSGTGPITEPDLANVYRQETGQSPSESALAQLQRLPGLTERGGEAGARSFVDEDLLAALQGSAFAQALILKKAPPQAGRWLNPLSEKAAAMAIHVLHESGLDVDDILNAARHGEIADLDDDQPFADAVALGIAMARQAGEDFSGRGIAVSGGRFHRIDFEEMALSDLTLDTCEIEEVIIGDRAAESSVRFNSCLVGSVFGAPTYDVLPRHLFPVGRDASVVETYPQIETNNAIQAQGWPPRITALTVVLKKLFDQPGSGRKLSAFERGITRTDVRSSVQGALRELRNAGFVTIHGDVAHPVRKMTARAQAVIRNPLRSDDPVAVAARA